MSLLSILNAFGLTVSLKPGGGVRVSGLSPLPEKEKAAALAFIRLHKKELENLAWSPSPVQLAHARRLTLYCPIQKKRLHCWYCSRCGDADTCGAWRSLSRWVRTFKNAGPPCSLHLVEDEEAGGEKNAGAFQASRRMPENGL